MNCNDSVPSIRLVIIYPQISTDFHRFPSSEFDEILKDRKFSVLPPPTKCKSARLQRIVKTTFMVRSLDEISGNL